MNNTMRKSVNPEFSPLKRALLPLALMAAAANGATAVPAEEPARPGETDRTGSFFCSLTEAEEVISGKTTFDPLGDYLRPPFRVEVPEADREHLTLEGYAQDGGYYWYIKTQPTEFGTYTIHGAFDFERKTLSTSRSIVTTLESGKIATVATSFFFLCESAD